MNKALGYAVALFLTAMFPCISGANDVIPLPLGLYFLRFLYSNAHSSDYLVLAMAGTAVVSSLAASLLRARIPRKVLLIVAMGFYAGMIVLAIRYWRMSDFHWIEVPTYFPFVFCVGLGLWAMWAGSGKLWPYLF